MHINFFDKKMLLNYIECLKAFLIEEPLRYYVKDIFETKIYLIFPCSIDL
jgi:hypothetical protein